MESFGTAIAFGFLICRMSTIVTVLKIKWDDVHEVLSTVFGTYTMVNKW